jgi:hypothetical protein
VDRAAQEMDNEWEDGGSTLEIMLQECHEDVVNIAVTFRVGSG